MPFCSAKRMGRRLPIMSYHNLNIIYGATGKCKEKIRRVSKRGGPPVVQPLSQLIRSVRSKSEYSLSAL